MNLRKRIITSLIILILLPIALLIIGILCFLAYQDNVRSDKYGTDSGAVESLANPVKVLDNLTSGAYQEMYECMQENPDMLVDRDYLKNISDKIDSRYAFLAVREDDDFIFIGDEQIFEKIESQLPGYGGGLDENQLMYISGNYPMLLKQLDFTTSEKEQASAYIIINMHQVVPRIKEMGTQIIFQLLLVVTCTAIVLIIWLYKSMLKPLNGLSSAAKRITEGDLDFTIEEETDDEIGTLCADFENMRKKLKEYIERQQLYEKESRELISNISHDLKTPLTAIKGYSEGLLDGVADTREKQEKYIRTIFSKANDMTALVDELSLYSKIDTDLMPYNFSPINVKNYFGDCFDEINMDMEIMGIKVGYYNYVNDDVVVMADAEQLKRVINNIIGNSVKYIDKTPGFINIRLNDREKEVEVSIEDNGKGIADSDIEKIFDRFYRADSSRNSKKGGTGLGLSIAKKIVNDHGGRIWAKSREGVGTEIYFTLKKYTRREDDNEQNTDN